MPTKISASANNNSGRGWRRSAAHASTTSGTPRMMAPASLAGIMARRAGNVGCNKRSALHRSTVVQRRHGCQRNAASPYCALRLSRPAPFRLQPGGAAGLGEVAHAQDVALTLGHGDNAAGVEQVEDVR